MLTEKERKELIIAYTKNITKSLCLLKDLCLANSEKIDKSVKYIIENLSSEIQQGFTRYYTNYFSYPERVFDLAMNLASELNKETFGVYDFTKSIEKYIKYAIQCSECHTIYIINQAYLDAIYNGRVNENYPHLIDQGYWCSTCKENTGYHVYHGPLSKKIQDLALEKEE